MRHHKKEKLELNTKYINIKGIMIVIFAVKSIIANRKIRS